MSDPRAGPPANLDRASRATLVLELQRAQGNAHVTRLVAGWQRGAAEGTSHRDDTLLARSHAAVRAPGTATTDRHPPQGAERQQTASRTGAERGDFPTGAAPSPDRPVADGVQRKDAPPEESPRIRRINQLVQEELDTVSPSYKVLLQALISAKEIGGLAQLVADLRGRSHEDHDTYFGALLAVIKGSGGEGIYRVALKLCAEAGAPVTEAPPATWSITSAMYRRMIASTRSTRDTQLAIARAVANKLPERLQPIAHKLIDGVKAVYDTLISLGFAVVGFVVGLAKGVIEAVKGLVLLIMLAGKSLHMVMSGRWLPWMLNEYRSDPRRFFERYVEGRILDEFVKGFWSAVKLKAASWLQQFKKAPTERQSAMIGELTGEVVAFIASFWTPGSGAGKAGRAAKAGEAAKLAGPAGEAGTAAAQMGKVTEAAKAALGVHAPPVPPPGSSPLRYVSDVVVAIRNKFFRPADLRAIRKSLLAHAHKSFVKLFDELRAAKKILPLTEEAVSKALGHAEYLSLKAEGYFSRRLGGFYHPGKDIVFIRPGVTVHETASWVVHELSHKLELMLGKKLGTFESEFQAFMAQKVFLRRVALEAGADAVPTGMRWLLDASVQRVEEHILQGYTEAVKLAGTDLKKLVVDAFRSLGRFAKE